MGLHNSPARTVGRTALLEAVFVPRGPEHAELCTGTTTAHEVMPRPVND